MVAAFWQEFGELGRAHVHPRVHLVGDRGRFDEVDDVAEPVCPDGAPGEPRSGESQGGDSATLGVEGGHVAQREASPDITVGRVPGFVGPGECGGGELQPTATSQWFLLDHRLCAQREFGFG